MNKDFCVLNIVAAFQGMHASPGKQLALCDYQESVTTRHIPSNACVTTKHRHKNSGNIPRNACVACET